MKEKKNIVLIGMPGSGKSTIGVILAKALGMGFADTIEGFQDKTLEECRRLGINDSMIHEDFMIGCDSMNIDAVCEDGSVRPIFRSGNWAF